MLTLISKERVPAVWWQVLDTSPAHVLPYQEGQEGPEPGERQRGRESRGDVTHSEAGVRAWGKSAPVARVASSSYHNITCYASLWSIGLDNCIIGRARLPSVLWVPCSQASCQIKQAHASQWVVRSSSIRVNIDRWRSWFSSNWIIHFVMILRGQPRDQRDQQRVSRPAFRAQVSIVLVKLSGVWRFTA